MKTLISPILLTSSLTLGVTTLGIPAAQGATWTYNAIPTSKACYADSRIDPNTALCSNPNDPIDFLTTGYLNGSNTVTPRGTQNIYAAFDLSNIISDLQTLQTNNPNSDYLVRIVNANVTALQSSENDANPNNPNGSPRLQPSFTRITQFDARLTTTTWNESTLTFANKPTVNPASMPLFSGAISANANGTRLNTYTGDGLNGFFDQVLNGAVSGTPTPSELSFGIQSTTGNFRPNLPFRAFPIDDFVAGSFNLNLQLEVYERQLWTAVNRIGGKNTWEHALTTDNTGIVIPTPIDRTWVSNQQVPFRLLYDEATRQVQFILNPSSANPQITTYTAPPLTANNKLEGIEILANVRTGFCANGIDQSVSPNTRSTLQVTSIRARGSSTSVNIKPTAGTASAIEPTIPGFEQQKMFIPFSQILTSATNKDASRIDGFVNINWPASGVNPQTSCRDGANARITSQIIPYSTIPQTSLPTTTASPDIQSTPEPSSIFGLLLMGTAGIRLRRQSNKEDDKK